MEGHAEARHQTRAKAVSVIYIGTKVFVLIYVQHT